MHSTGIGGRWKQHMCEPDDLSSTVEGETRRPLPRCLPLFFPPRKRHNRHTTQTPTIVPGKLLVKPSP